MTKRQFGRNLLLLSGLLVVAFVMPFVKDEIAYQAYSHRIEAAQSKIKVGMSEAEVRSVMGDPDEITENENGRFWSWEAREHQGESFKKSGLWTSKGHYGVLVEFDETNRVRWLEGAVN